MSSQKSWYIVVDSCDPVPHIVSFYVESLEELARKMTDNSIIGRSMGARVWNGGAIEMPIETKIKIVEDIVDGKNEYLKIFTIEDLQSGADIILSD